MTDRPIVAWITKGGMHIPIYASNEPTDDENKKNKDIAQAKEQADRLNNKIYDEFIGIFGLKKSASVTQTKVQELMQNNTINPHYAESREYQNNCGNCTVATIMQCRGYDVEADKANRYYYCAEDVLQCDFTNPNNYMLDSSDNPFINPIAVKRYIYNNAKPRIELFSSISTTQAPRGADKCSAKIQKLVSSWGDGAYGELSVTWKTGSSHSLFIYNDKGKVVVYDSQDNTKTDDLLTLLKGTRANNTMLLRLDNAKFKSGANRKLMLMIKRRNK